MSTGNERFKRNEKPQLLGNLKFQTWDHQPQSPFFTRLPREIRDAIYLELWRSEGEAQHIFWHEDTTNPENSKFCFWPCKTKFNVENEAQDELEKIWRDGRLWRGIPVNPLWHARLQSRWLNHWRCEEDLLTALEEAGLNADRYQAGGEKLTRFHCPCELGDRLPRKSYLPMLLSCKAIYVECIETMYESTRFVLIDTSTIQRILGSCGGPILGISSPVKPVIQQIRNLDISLPIDFPTRLSCYGLSRDVHWGNDFHWLHLPEMKTCREVNIYVDARRRDAYLEPLTNTYVRMANLDYSAILIGLVIARDLKGSSCAITISTPLAMGGSQRSGFTGDYRRSGFLEESKSLPNFRIWRRYWGDAFQPLPPALGTPEGSIYVDYRLRTVREGEFTTPPDDEDSVIGGVYSGGGSSVSSRPL